MLFLGSVPRLGYNKGGTVRLARIGKRDRCRICWSKDLAGSIPASNTQRLAQRVEHQIQNLTVVGSNPTPNTAQAVQERLEGNV